MMKDHMMDVADIIIKDGSGRPNTEKYCVCWKHTLIGTWITHSYHETETEAKTARDKIHAHYNAPAFRVENPEAASEFKVIYRIP